jgi:hypothetical protein
MELARAVVLRKIVGMPHLCIILIEEIGKNTQKTIYHASGTIFIAFSSGQTTQW